MGTVETSTPPLLKTPLHALHVQLGARMAAFAGYDMPIQFPDGIVAEHLHTRAHAGLFDVSHMGQAFLEGPDAVASLERLVPGDVAGLAPGQIRYTQLLDANGAILDDLMVTRAADASGGTQRLFLVVNAARKAHDFALIAKTLAGSRLHVLADRALLALQGPAAAAVAAKRWPAVATMPFMTLTVLGDDEDAIFVSRSGYTGEDGYEISVPAGKALELAQALLAEPEVRPIGLGARDSLRLEAGLCLYGHDIDTTTDPVTAGLAWSIGKRRREGGGFPGADIVRHALASGPARKRVGLLIEGRAVAREGAEITTPDGTPVGRITSGGHAPSLNRPIAMGIVAAAHAAPGTALHVIVRGKPIPATVTKLPFVAHRYFKPTV